MKQKLEALFNFGKKVFQEWSDDKAPRLSAALAYYTVFSLAPLLIVVVAVAGLVFGASQAQSQILNQLSGLVGPSGADLIKSLLENANRPAAGILATIFGLIMIVLGATGVFGELKDSLNTIWNVAPKPDRGWMGMIRDRVLSFAMLLAIGFLLLVSLVLSAGLSAFGSWFSSHLGSWELLAQALDIIISFVVVALLFAILFKFLPDVKIAWRDVWLGAIVTALLFTIGKFLIGFYLGNSNVTSPYGAAGSVIVLLIWVYYSAQILFFGAEVTQVYAYSYGSGVQPASDAVALSDAARVAQGTLKPDKAAVTAAAAQQQPVSQVVARQDHPSGSRPAHKSAAKADQLPAHATEAEPKQPDTVRQSSRQQLGVAIKAYLMVWGAFVAALVASRVLGGGHKGAL